MKDEYIRGERPFQQFDFGQDVTYNYSKSGTRGETYHDLFESGQEVLLENGVPYEFYEFEEYIFRRGRMCVGVFRRVTMTFQTTTMATSTRKLINLIPSFFFIILPHSERDQSKTRYDEIGGLDVGGYNLVLLHDIYRVLPPLYVSVTEAESLRVFALPEIPRVDIAKYGGHVFFAACVGRRVLLDCRVGALSMFSVSER